MHQIRLWRNLDTNEFVIMAVDEGWNELERCSDIATEVMGVSYTEVFQPFEEKQLAAYMKNKVRRQLRSAGCTELQVEPLIRKREKIVRIKA